MTDYSALPSEARHGKAEPPIPDREVVSAWAREARRRYDEIRAGRRRTIGNDEVFARLRARFG